MFRGEGVLRVGCMGFFVFSKQCRELLDSSEEHLASLV